MQRNPQFSTAGYQHALVAGLRASGWRIVALPLKGKVTRNGQAYVLRAHAEERRVRIWVFKVTVSSRGRPHERRVEITTTYQTGLRRRRGFRDIILGFDIEHRVFVGFDPRRQQAGGPTGNASSFLDSDGISESRRRGMHVRARKTDLIQSGVEYQAFFTPRHLAEYLFNADQIHAGNYDLRGSFSHPLRASPEGVSVGPIVLADDLIKLMSPLNSRRRIQIKSADVSRFETSRSLASRHSISVEQLRQIQKRCEENGKLGEEYVLEFERRRLARAGRPDLARRIHWVSQTSVSAGYDVQSYETNGSARYIEVKATQSSGGAFPMSIGEWDAASRHAKKYAIYRVTNVRTLPSLTQLWNPVELAAAGRIRLVASGWIVAASSGTNSNLRGKPTVTKNSK
jgi:hypothetical protein